MEPREPEYLRDLVRELRELPAESEWVEFKVNNTDPDTIGKNVSALSNGAALHGRSFGYLIWGVANDTHEVVGTNFTLEPKGRGPLEPRIRASISENCDFQFHSIDIDDHQVVALEINPARKFPVKFKGEAYIRVGTATKPLNNVAQIEARLWRILDQNSFEDGIADANVSSERVLELLDCPSYFRLLGMPLPDGNRNILDAMRSDGLIKRSDAGGWDITNLAAILLANDLSPFPRLWRKTLRVIQYEGTDKLRTVREWECKRGYAVEFERIIEYVMALVPSNEVLTNALNQSVPMFPADAVRELVANALIHQDFSVTGTGPMVEIFVDRIEMTNPGDPLVETDRWVDHPPRSRNDRLASLMRRFGFCEERGLGIDRVVATVEAAQLPAPRFEIPGDFTRSVLFAHKPLNAMDKDERIRACYWHACLRYVNSQITNNTSIRERFGIAKHNSAQATKLLNDAVTAGALVVRDPSVGNRIRSYLPHWASAVRMR